MAGTFTAVLTPPICTSMFCQHSIRNGGQSSTSTAAATSMSTGMTKPRAFNYIHIVCRECSPSHYRCRNQSQNHEYLLTDHDPPAAKSLSPWRLDDARQSCCSLPPTSAPAMFFFFSLFPYTCIIMPVCSQPGSKQAYIHCRFGRQTPKAVAVAITPKTSCVKLEM